MSAPIISWENDHLTVLDQTKLPLREQSVTLTKPEDYIHAIRVMKVRGAPLIGIVAAYGVAQAALNSQNEQFAVFEKQVRRALENLASTRPTAVNLFWALKRMQSVFDDNILRSPQEHARSLLAEAKTIHTEQIDADRAMAKIGAALIPRGSNVLTICNTGALATGGQGTALGVIFEAHRQKRVTRVFPAETRPRMQGRLTAWELHKRRVPYRLVPDTSIGALLRDGNITIAIVGADRIAANGDVANKIGTYQMAVLCAWHKVQLIVAAPRSTFDSECPTGAEITIEERDGDEIRKVGRCFILPKEYIVWNQAFDITPRELISHYVSEDGIEAGGRRDK